MIKKKTTNSRTRTKKKPIELSTGELISNITSALTELYPFDVTKPGLVLSHIDKNKGYYASIVRYETHGKVVMSAAYGETLDEAVQSLVSQWKSGVKNATTVLAKGRRR